MMSMPDRKRVLQRGCPLSYTIGEPSEFVFQLEPDGAGVPGITLESSEQSAVYFGEPEDAAYDSATGILSFDATPYWKDDRSGSGDVTVTITSPDETVIRICSVTIDD